MLTIRTDQSPLFLQHAQRCHAFRAVRELAAQYPAFFRQLLPRDIDAAAKEALDCAATLGLAGSVGAIERFVALWFSAGPRFHERPAVVALLATQSLPAEARLEQVIFALTDDDVAALGPVLPTPQTKPLACGEAAAITDGIRLRALTTADAPELAGVLADAAVSGPAGLDHLRNTDDVRTWIDALIRNRSCLACAIADDGTGAIGAVVLRTLGYAAGLSYWLGQPYWGKRIGTRAVRIVLRYARSVQGLEHVFARVAAQAERSQRLLHGLGFQQLALAGPIGPAMPILYHLGPTTDAGDLRSIALSVLE